MFGGRRIVTAFLLAGVLLGFGAEARSAQKAESISPASFIPADAQWFVHINFRDLWTAEKAAKSRQQSPEAAKAIESLFAELTGLPLTDLCTLSGVMAPTVQKDENLEPVWIITTAKAYDRTKAKAQMRPDPLSRQYKGHDYIAARRPKLVFGKLEDFLNGKEDLVSDDRDAVLFVNERAFVVGQERALRRWMDRPKTGPWADQLREATRHHVVFAARADKELQAQLHDAVPEALRPLLAAERLLLTAHFADAIRIEIAQAYRDEAAAKQGRQASNAGWPLLREQVRALAKEATPKEPIPAFARLLKSADEALAAPSCKQVGREVRVQIQMQTDAIGLVTAFGEVINLGRNASATFQRVGDEIGPAPGERPRNPEPKRP
jgi:hypothetical protein